MYYGKISSPRLEILPTGLEIICSKNGAWHVTISLSHGQIIGNIGLKIAVLSVDSVYFSLGVNGNKLLGWWCRVQRTILTLIYRIC